MAFIMIVDDNPDLCRALSRSLRSLGHKVAIFLGGEDALTFIQNPVHPLPDLVILDYMMPEKDGLSVLRDLRAGHKGSNVPVAIFTANDDPKIEFQARVAGANDFWVKLRMDLSNIEQSVRRLLPNPAES
jgi:CheY-like chemotaxis protein